MNDHSHPLPRRANAIFMVTAALLTSVAAPSSADSTWNNANGTNLWTEPDNWAPQSLPTTADIVSFPAPVPPPDGAIDLDGQSVVADTLVFEADGYSLSNGTLSLTSGTITTVDTDATVGARLSGGNGLTKTGPGRVLLTGSNAYTGDNRLEGGTLAIVNNNNLGALSADVRFAGGTLETTDGRFINTSRGFVATSDSSPASINTQSGSVLLISGGITGPGGLVKSGPGAIGLTSTSSDYSGPTVIDNGQIGVVGNERLPDTADLTINAGSFTLESNTTETIGSISGVGFVAFLSGAGNHLLVGANNADSTYDGNILDLGGSGRLTKTGIGTLTLTGNNTYGQGTSVQNGTLVADTDALPTPGGVDNHATLVFDQTSDGTYTGVVTGPGDLEKTGSGTLLLDAANTYTGQTTVVGGTLGGNGSVTSPVTIADNATLAPGSSTGTFTIHDNLALSPLSTVAVEVTPTDNDLLVVDGTVTLDGTLAVDTAGAPGIEDVALGTTYTVMTYAARGAAGDETMFDSITGTLLNTSLTLAPIFDDADTSLTLRASIPGDLNLDNKVSVADLSTFALNFNTTPGLYVEATDTNSWELGDFNTDGAITVADLSLLALNFGFDVVDPTSTPLGLSLEAAAALAGIDATVIPEPATVGALSVGLLAFAGRRHKRTNVTKA